MPIAIRQIAVRRANMRLSPNIPKPELIDG
jgi:hypothetical protein